MQVVATNVQTKPDVYRYVMGIKPVGRKIAEEKDNIHTPADVAALVQKVLGDRGYTEHFWMIALDTKNNVNGIVEIYTGGVSSIVVRAAEIFRPAVLLNATSVIVAHNHPSGDPTPSPEDVEMTSILVEAGKNLDITLLDHIIVGGSHYCSLKERGLVF